MLPASTATHPGTVTSHCQSNEAIIGEEKKKKRENIFFSALSCSWEDLKTLVVSSCPVCEE